MNFFKISLATLIILLSSLVLSSQVEFNPTVIATSNFPVFKNCVVDMDGDHIDDVVAISAASLVIASQQNDGGFVFKYHFQDFENTPDWSICAGDIDANGFNDLIIGGRSAVSFVYANDNGSAYTEDAKSDYIFSQRTNFVDIDNDGHLDAFICHDENQNHPYRNDGDGNLFLDQTLITTPANTPGNYESVWVDYDNDGDLDCHIAKCVQIASAGDPSRINLLYNNDGNGQFTEVAEAAGLADGDQSWVSMFEDYNNDGYLDVFTLNHEISNQFMINNGDGTFRNVTASSGLENSDLNAFEGIAADFDNDGDIDILRDRPSKFYYNNGDMTFTEEETNVQLGALGDMNSDGFLDIVSNNLIFYNSGNANHWMRINIVGQESNRNGIGARVEAYGDFGIKIREVRAGRSWSTMSTLGVHFGIGQHTEIDSIVVKWPSGLKSILENPSIDQAHTIDELDCPTELVGVVIDGPLQFCEGESLVLTAPSGFDYLWSTGETSQSISIEQSGGYNVTVTHSGGCTSYSKPIYGKYLDDPITVFAPDGIQFCGAAIRLQADTDLPLVWSTGDTTSIIWIDEEGDYFATIETECGSTIQSQVINVERIAVPTPVAIDTVVTKGIEFLVLHQDGDFVFWYETENSTQPIFIINDLILADVVENDTFWVQIVNYLPTGEECYSERVRVTITVETSSVIDYASQIGLQVYPNPARQHIHVSLNENHLANLRLRDLSGREVMHFSRSLSDEYDISGLETGVYLLEIDLGDQSVIQKIIVTD